jgi:hypothetical protein
LRVWGTRVTMDHAADKCREILRKTSMTSSSVSLRMVGRASAYCARSKLSVAEPAPRHCSAMISWARAACTSRWYPPRYNCLPSCQTCPSNLPVRRCLVTPRYLLLCLGKRTCGRSCCTPTSSTVPPAPSPPPRVSFSVAMGSPTVSAGSDTATVVVALIMTASTASNSTSICTSSNGFVSTGVEPTKFLSPDLLSLFRTV